MDCSTQGLPVPHHLPQFAQVHLHCIGVAIQPPHPLMPFSPSAFNLSQHQGLLQWVSCSNQMLKNTGASASTSVPPVNFQDWFPLRLTSLTVCVLFYLPKVSSNVLCLDCFHEQKGFHRHRKTFWNEVYLPVVNGGYLRRMKFRNILFLICTFLHFIILNKRL